MKRWNSGEGSRRLLGGGKGGVVVGMLANAANVFHVFELVVRRDDKDRTSQHAIERAAGNQ